MVTCWQIGMLFFVIYICKIHFFQFYQVEDMLTKEKLDDFLTTVCYPHILTSVYEGELIPEDDTSMIPHSKL